MSSLSRGNVYVVNYHTSNGWKDDDIDKYRMKNKILKVLLGQPGACWVVGAGDGERGWV